ncbi:MAG: sporulation protein YqfD [Clostridia bacterium]|nr:sporulation protein YqfD [Clostridia bacterium]
MKNFFMHLFVSSVCVRVYGLNSLSVIGKMVEKGGVFYEVEKTENGFICEMRYDLFLSLKQYCKKRKIKFEVLKKKGLIGACHFALSHIGAFLALSFWLVFSLVFFNSNNTVVVDAEELSVAEKQQIENCVKSLLTQNLSNLEMERAVLIEFDNVSACTIKRNGMYVSVWAQKRVQDVASKDIVAEFDCKIKSLVVASGEGVAKPGDIVLKGQTIARGGEENGKVIPASVKMLAEAYVIGSCIYDEKGEKLLRSGNTKTYRLIESFGLKFGKVQSPFYYFDVQESRKLVSNVLPIYLVEKTFYEKTLQTTIVPFESVREEVVLRAKNDALDKLNGWTDVYEEKVFVSDDGGVVKVDYYLKFAYEI